MMAGNILNSQGTRVAMVVGSEIYDLAGKKLYDLKGSNIYLLSGELVGHFERLGQASCSLDRQAISRPQAALERLVPSASSSTKAREGLDKDAIDPFRRL
jgi:hypothetical protein